MNQSHKRADDLNDSQVPAIEIEIIEQSPLWESRTSLEEGIVSAVQTTFLFADVNFPKEQQDEQEGFQLTIVLSNNEEVQSLNNHFRNKDKPTNVLSFPFANEDTILPPGEARPLGDIVLAFETIKQEALDQNIDLDHHIYHLVIHGLLHLLGYDHENEADAEIMENKEKDIMHRLNLPNPYTH